LPIPVTITILNTGRINTGTFTGTLAATVLEKIQKPKKAMTSRVMYQSILQTPIIKKFGD